MSGKRYPEEFKLALAHQSTTIGDLIEALVKKHL